MSAPVILRKEAAPGASSSTAPRSAATKASALKGSEGYEAQAKALQPGNEAKSDLEGPGSAGGAGGGAAAQPIPDALEGIRDGAKKKGAPAAAPAGAEAATTKSDAAALEEKAGPSKAGGGGADFVKQADDMLKRSVEHAKTAAGAAKEVAVSKPGDAHEKEADKVAEIVTKGPAAAGAEAKGGEAQGAAGAEAKGAAVAAASTSKAGVAAGVTGATCAECGGAMIAKSKGAAPTCSTCGKSGAPPSSVATPQFKGVARKAVPAAAGVGKVGQAGESTVPGDAGKPVDASLRKEVEPVVGADLSNVRVHEGEDAAGKAGQYGAKAYTSGSHVVLGKGQSAADKGLMAHELTHAAHHQGGGAAKVSRLSLDDVIPDSIMNWFRGASGQASSLGTGLTSTAQTSATSAQTEAAGVPGQAQGTADGGVAAAQQQGEAASAQASAEQQAASADATQTSAQAASQAAGMQAAGPTAAYASDPVRPLVEPPPAGGMAAGAGGGAGAAAQAPAPSAGGGGGGGGAAAQAPAPSAGGGGGGGGAAAQAP
ncbi:MAG: DUF4157 domain-containing protein, partial [Polyangiaceae bacterium]|nr:DUF4157 domain-containing protein [Polyangiaceae bacterium]